MFLCLLMLFIDNLKIYIYVYVKKIEHPFFHGRYHDPDCILNVCMYCPAQHLQD